MDRLEVLVIRIIAFSNRVGDIEHLRKFLTSSEEKGLLRTQPSRLYSALQQLNPSEHSLGYLFILEAYSATAPVSREEASILVSTVAKFIDSCVTEQIRLAPEKFLSVCRRFRDTVLLLQTPLRGVAPMKKAIQKIQTSSGKLTALHPDFLLLCLLAKCYKIGYSILADDIYEVDQPKDLLLYCYYGGMVCIGQKCYQKAIDLLRTVVTAPTSGGSAIAMEGLKKYILVSLIHTGQFPDDSPNHACALTSKSTQNLCQTYYFLEEIYGSGRISELKKFVADNRVEFNSDKNFGLVKQVVSSLYKRNIKRLTKAYVTLSLEEIAKRVQLDTPKEAEMHVLEMIQDGQIFATINQKDGMVNFDEDPEQYKTCEMVDHIDSSIQRTIALSKKLKDTNDILSCDAAYLTKIEQRRRHSIESDFIDPRWGHAIEQALNQRGDLEQLGFPY